MKRTSRFQRFARDIVLHTPFLRMVFLLVFLWLLFAAAMYFAERGSENATITSYGEALYWGTAAFSTAGIADTPHSAISQFIGAVWIVVGSVLFFGTIVSTVTTYFMRPLYRPSKQIIETIEYNLERLDDLSVDELDLLKETTDALIIHMERLKEARRESHAPGQAGRPVD